MSDKRLSLPLAVLCAAMLVACGKSETPSVPPAVPSTKPADEAAMQTGAATSLAGPQAQVVKGNDQGARVEAESAAAKAAAKAAPSVASPAGSTADKPAAKAEAAVALVRPSTEKSGDSGMQAAVEMPDLAKKNGCVACHAIDKKLIGPAWMDVSKKYKGAKEYAYSPKGSATPDAKKLPLVEGLMMKVSKGGTGNWGSAAMIANDPTGKKQDQIKELVEFVLGLAQ